MTLAALIFGLPAAQGALTSGLVTYLDFEDLQNAPEASGPDATIVGDIVGTGIAGGRAGNAAEFDGGTGDLISLGISYGAGATDLGQEFTIGGWYNLDNPPSSDTGRFFVFESSNNYEISYGLRSFGAGDGLVDGQSYTSNGQNLLLTNGHETETWQHVLQTFTLNAGTTTIETFIDGVSQGTISNGGAIGSTGVNIGNARNTALNRAFDGKIDEFAAWDRVLTQDEITDAYNLGLNGQALTTIPEPSSVLLCGLAGLSLLIRRRS